MLTPIRHTQRYFVFESRNSSIDGRLMSSVVPAESGLTSPQLNDSLLRRINKIHSIANL
jgi:hypothetical protein